MFLLKWLAPMLLVTAIAVNCSEEQKNQYRDDQNKQRKKLGIPLVPGNWVLHDSTESDMKWLNPDQTVAKEPVHLYKRIRLKAQQPVIETDVFHYQHDDSISYRLVQTFHYRTNSASHQMIFYFPGKYPPTATRSISTVEADSVFKSWGFAHVSTQH